MWRTVYRSATPSFTVATSSARLLTQYFTTGVQSSRQEAFRAIRLCAIQRASDPHRHPHRRLALHREVGENA
jgi:hypothetical protein